MKNHVGFVTFADPTKQMKEYVYQEDKYIKRKDLNEYEELMASYDFLPEEIDNEVEFNIVLQYPRSRTIPLVCQINLKTQPNRFLNYFIF